MSAQEINLALRTAAGHERAATYRDDEDQAMRDALEAEGVPSDWHRPNEGDE
jgi:hypothetical protein